MRAGVLLYLCVTITAGPAFAGATVEQEGPLSPCAQTPGGASAGSPAAQAQPWGVEIATAFSKEEALAEFDRVKQDHSDILGSDPIIVAQCDLHLGTKLQYSARIGAASREDADALCAKLRASGGACIVQKN
jgi:sporulation related protein